MIGNVVAPFIRGDFATNAIVADEVFLRGDRVRVLYAFVAAENGGLTTRHYIKSYLYLSAEQVAAAMSRAGLVDVRAHDLSGDHVYSGEEWYVVAGTKP